MLWKRPKQCVVCAFTSRRGEIIHGRFMCYACEMAMVEELATEQEGREYAEMQRISNQHNGEGFRIG